MKTPINDIWRQFALDPPPAHLSDELVQWVERMSAHMHVTFADPPGVTPAELAALITLGGGDIHPDLAFFYTHYHPWHAYRHGLDVWRRTVERIRRRSALIAGHPDAPPHIPALWPISLGDQQDIVAFPDRRERLAIISLDHDQRPTWVRAIGIIGYFSAIVLVEWLLDQGRYASHQEAAQDPHVLRVSNWDSHDPPVHPLLLAA